MDFLQKDLLFRQGGVYQFLGNPAFGDLVLQMAVCLRQFGRPFIYQAFQLFLIKRKFGLCALAPGHVATAPRCRRRGTSAAR